MSQPHAESFKDEGFTEFSQTEGRAEMTLEGETQGFDYRSKNFVNPKGTIAYAEVEAEDSVDTLFISNTAHGVVFSFPSDNPGPVPFPMEGYHAVMGLPEESTVEESYAFHLKGLEGVEALADEGWLREQTPVLPQRAMEAMFLFFQVLSQEGGPMEQIMGAVGSAIEDGLLNMASEIGQAIEEGVEKTLSDEEDEFETDDEVDEKQS